MGRLGILGQLVAEASLGAVALAVAGALGVLQLRIYGLEFLIDLTRASAIESPLVLVAILLADFGFIYLLARDSMRSV